MTRHLHATWSPVARASRSNPPGRVHPMSRQSVRMNSDQIAAHVLVLEERLLDSDTRSSAPVLATPARRRLHRIRRLRTGVDQTGDHCPPRRIDRDFASHSNRQQLRDQRAGRRPHSGDLPLSALIAGLRHRLVHGTKFDLAEQRRDLADGVPSGHTDTPMRRWPM